MSVGRIANLQFIQGRDQWLADLVVLRETGDGIYSEVKTRRQTEYMDVEELQPVRASYVRSSDGYKVPLDFEGAIIPYATSYRVDASFALPVKEVDEEKVRPADTPAFRRHSCLPCLHSLPPWSSVVRFSLG